MRGALGRVGVGGTQQTRKRAERLNGEERVTQTSLSESGPMNLRAFNVFVCPSPDLFAV